MFVYVLPGIPRTAVFSRPSWPSSSSSLSPPPPPPECPTPHGNIIGTNQCAFGRSIGRNNLVCLFAKTRCMKILTSYRRLRKRVVTVVIRSSYEYVVTRDSSVNNFVRYSIFISIRLSFVRKFDVRVAIIFFINII